MTVSIKLEPALRHAFAHTFYAVEVLAKGEAAEARYEVESIRDLVEADWNADLAIRQEPEIRRAFEGLHAALVALAIGEPARARYALEEVKALVFWDTDEGQTTDARAWLAAQEPQEDRDEELQG